MTRVADQLWIAPGFFACVCQRQRKLAGSTWYIGCNLASSKMAVFDVILNDKITDLKDVLLSDPKCANSVGWHGLTPLHQAVLKNNQEMVDLLMEYGANLNQPNSYGETPLHFACQAASLQNVNKFVEVGAELRAVDSAGRTCIHHAAKSGSV